MTDTQRAAFEAYYAQREQHDSGMISTFINVREGWEAALKWQAAQAADAGREDREPSTGDCFFCGKPINGRPAKDCLDPSNHDSLVADLVEALEAVMQVLDEPAGCKPEIIADKGKLGNRNNVWKP